MYIRVCICLMQTQKYDELSEVFLRVDSKIF